MRLPLGTPTGLTNAGRALVGVAIAVILICVVWLLGRPAPQPAAPIIASGPRPVVEAVATLSIGDLERLLTDMSYEPERMQPDRKPPDAAAGESVPSGPFLKITRRGYTFFIRFFDCQDAATATGCQTVEVVSGSFMLTPAPSPAEIITWNRQSWWAFAVADADGLPYLRSYFSTTGGVSEAFIRNFFQLWDWRVTKFAQFIKELSDSRDHNHE